MTKDDAETGRGYKVGYGKPPAHTQFKPGQSGNPRGRPKTPKNVEKLIEAELDQIVTLQEGGQSIRISKRHALIKQLVNMAIKGNTKPLQLVLTHLEKTRVPEPFVPSAADDAEILRAFGLAAPRDAYAKGIKDGDK